MQKFIILLLVTCALLLPVYANAANSPFPSPMTLVGKVLDDKNLIPGFKYGGDVKLNTVLSDLYQIIFYVATFVALFWLAWGIFEYIFAGGNKEKLASARKRMTWAIVGLIFVLLAFLIAQFTAQVILPKGSNQPAESLPILK